MVRTYIRKTERGNSYSEEDMVRAISKIDKKNMTIKRAAEIFNIPRSSIQTRLRRNQRGELQNKGRFKPVFDKQMELDLSKHLIASEKLFHGNSTSDVRRLAYQFAELNNIPHTFNRNRQMAGKDWLISFLRRQHNLSIRTPEPTSLARVTGFTERKVGIFFTNIQNMRNKYDFPPSRIFNCDETGVSTVQKPKKIVAQKGRKQVGRLVSAERGKNITLLACISATGAFIPPFMVYTRVRMKPELLSNSFPGTVGYANPSGWMDSSLFPKFIEHFVTATNTTMDKPSLLILDGHGSHKSLEAIELCRKHGVVMVTLPPHTSHRLQPLDVSVFGPFKAYLNSEMDKWMTSNPGQRIRDFDMSSIIKNAFMRAMTPTNIIKGFEKTGIHPWNPDVFDKSDFMGAAAAAAAATLPSATTEGGPACEEKAESEHPDKDESNETLEEVEKSNSKINASLEFEPPRASTPEQMPVSEDIRPRAEPIIDKDDDEGHLYYVPVSTIAPLPTPSTSGVTKRASRKQETSQIITGTPYKTQVEESARNKMNKSSVRKVFATKKQQPKAKMGKRQLNNNLEMSAKRKTTTKRPPEEDHDSEDDTNCLYCGEKYGDTKFEEWIRCQSCLQWMHEDCTDNEAKNDSFTCDNCR